jgi:hypothetical protein
MVRNFLEAYELVKAHNERYAAGIETYEMDLNEVSFKTERELGRIRAGASMRLVAQSSNKYDEYTKNETLPQNLTLPEEWDEWRKRKLVPSKVEHQVIDII